MTALSKRKLEFETVWINEYATTYDTCEDSFAFPPSLLRERGVNVISIRNVLRTGHVVASDKLDGPGALWTVEGVDEDGCELSVEVRVVADTMSVELLNIF